MYQPKMALTPEQLDILSGKQGETKAKMMEVLVRYGDVFGAKRMVPLTYKTGHLVTSFGISMLTTIYPLMDELIEAGLKAEGGFTADPRPMEFASCSANPLEKLVFTKIIYGRQKEYEGMLAKVGLKDKDSFSCTCYLPEVGNIPGKGDVISWAESSAVVYANSVLGAKCNRNSGVIDLFGAILGMVPEFGFLTEEGRKADFRVIVKTTKAPEAQILGSAIGMKVMEKVPYIEGLDRFLKPLPDEDTVAYLKDMGAASASNGAVGLYHVANLTPEAKELGEKLLKEGYQEYVIDDEEIERVYRSYPIMWKKKHKAPQRAFIGCPHLTYKQLCDWTEKFERGLAETGRKKLACYTVLTAAPQVVEKFKKSEHYARLMASGAHLASICPLMYAYNPLCGAKRLLTNSNKLRTYTFARYAKDEELLNILVGKEKIK